MRRHVFSLALVGALAALVASCRVNLDADDLEAAATPRVDAYFNYPNSRESNGFDNAADDMLVQMIDRAEATIDFAVMGFSQATIVDALVRAHERGVQLRFVGDARHMIGTVLGYVEMDALRIPMQVGNANHIMHDKFFIIDDHIVFVGTGNITPTGFARNNNNWTAIDSPAVAADFRAEFEQMLGGRFGFAKEAIDNGNTYEVGDATVEVYFSPQEDTMGRLLEAVESAEATIEFSIFAFTKDEVGSAFIAKHLEFQQYNACCDPSLAGDRDEAVCAPITCETPFEPRYVRGVIDRSQLHSNGPYHEAYRLLAFGIPMVLDGNDDSYQPGDYQAGGGRLHSKTVVIDAGRDTAVVVTGSFNWSSSATIANDETLLLIHSPRVAASYADYFEMLWTQGKPFGERWIGDDTGLQAGDIVFNEIQWDGYDGELDPQSTSRELAANDEFIELLNLTADTIRLDMWTIATDDDFVLGFYPGTVIGPYERFVVVNHNTSAYNDIDPQLAGGAYEEAEYVMNMANDPRFLSLNLHNLRFRLRLLDPHGQVMDVVGDGGPPFAGGRVQVGDGLINRSMERVHFVCEQGADCEAVVAGLPDGVAGRQACYGATCDIVLDGESPAAWQACQLEEGGENVRDDYQSFIFASPGEPNSGGEGVPDEDPTFRSPSGERGGW